LRRGTCDRNDVCPALAITGFQSLLHSLLAVLRHTTVPRSGIILKGDEAPRYYLLQTPRLVLPNEARDPRKGLRNSLRGFLHYWWSCNLFAARQSWKSSWRIRIIIYICHSALGNRYDWCSLWFGFATREVTNMRTDGTIIDWLDYVRFLRR
jgi:hypothetical protein